MAMEIKAIPTLKGKEAEHFVKAADKLIKIKTNKTSANMCWKPVLCSKRLKCYKTWDFFLRNVLLPYLMKIRLKNVTLSHVGTKT